MKKILFTYPSTLENELDRIIELFEDGIDFLHIRKPEFSLGQMVEFIGDIPSEFHDKIMLHDHFALVREYDLAGINLNRKSINQLVPEHEVDKCFIQPLVQTQNGIEVNRYPVKQVSYSAHSFDEINRLGLETDYVFLSPIFNSISKEGYYSNFTDNEILKEELSKINRDVIALGGIRDENIKFCENLGFKGVAFLGHVWGNFVEIEK